MASQIAESLCNTCFDDVRALIAGLRLIR